MGKVCAKAVPAAGLAAVHAMGAAGGIRHQDEAWRAGVCTEAGKLPIYDSNDPLLAGDGLVRFLL
ncbi:hypothetical protein DBR44_12435 [Aquitalea sp. FJL05]|nr:hypothetical protein DBR44_12435 [Aquitalea sp. FJL05]